MKERRGVIEDVSVLITPDTEVEMDGGRPVMAVVSYHLSLFGYAPNGEGIEASIAYKVSPKGDSYKLDIIADLTPLGIADEVIVSSVFPIKPQITEEGLVFYTNGQRRTVKKITNIITDAAVKLKAKVIKIVQKRNDYLRQVGLAETIII